MTTKAKKAMDSYKVPVLVQIEKGRSYKGYVKSLEPKNGKLTVKTQNGFKTVKANKVGPFLVTEKGNTPDMDAKQREMNAKKTTEAKKKKAAPKDPQAPNKVRPSEITEEEALINGLVNVTDEDSFNAAINAIDYAGMKIFQKRSGVECRMAQFKADSTGAMCINFKSPDGKKEYWSLPQYARRYFEVRK